ncbi:MAG: hypothetical protein EOP17_00065 [Rhizobiaceae bacterium]|nr:MAG: hypothetical protein EOP17_00065 [Rhizobiaceae bacterium]
MSKIVRIGAATTFFNDSHVGNAQLLENARGGTMMPTGLSASRSISKTLRNSCLACAATATSA